MMPRTMGREGALCGIFLALLLVVAPPSSVLAQPSRDEVTSRVDQLKKLGDDAMDNLRYEEALGHYTRAYDVEPRPALLYNRGRALEALTRYPEALDMILEFQAKAPPELKEQVPQLAQLVADLRSKVGELTVTSNVAGARVLLRKEMVGTTPLAGPLRVNAGPATVEVTADGYLPFRKEVTLPGGGATTVRADLVTKSTTGILRVAANVPGATVIVDGKRIGVAPAEATLAQGKHQVLVQAEGHEDVLTSAVVVAGDRRELRVSLEETPPITAKWWFWTGAGVVVAGGVALTVALLTERPADRGDIPPGQIAAPLFGF